MQVFDDFINANREQFLDELKEFVAQPSVSATGEGIDKMARMVREKMEGLGAEVRMLEVGPGEPPVVYASLGSGDKTLLIYNHYDVQPVDPIELWESPPFVPTIRDGKMFARGVSDNKGNLLYRIQAVRTWLETVGPLPFRLNWFIEGEEETGSPNLEPFCLAHADLLKADGCLWEMGNVDEADRPIFTLGAKGLLYVELSVQTLNGDQHSALGTLAPNAAWRLNWALSSLKAPDETILIDGFFDDVLPTSEVDLALLRAIPFEEEKMMAGMGAKQWVGGVSGLAAITRHLFQPTCTICGINGGYTGAGQKTVLPARASAKVGFRLVPNMEPARVAELLRNHLDRHGFEDIEMTVLGAEHPGKSDPNAGIVKAAVSAAQDVYELAPAIYPLTPGTGPVWPIAVAHGTPMVSFGASYPGQKLHAPNENIRLDDYFRAMRMMGRFIRDFGR